MYKTCQFPHLGVLFKYLSMLQLHVGDVKAAEVSFLHAQHCQQPLGKLDVLLHKGLLLSAHGKHAEALSVNQAAARLGKVNN